MATGTPRRFAAPHVRAADVFASSAEPLPPLLELKPEEEHQAHTRKHDDDESTPKQTQQENPGRTKKKAAALVPQVLWARDRRHFYARLASDAFLDRYFERRPVLFRVGGGGFARRSCPRST